MMIIGAVFAVVGLIMLSRGRKEGRNAVKALGVELELSSSAILLFLAGVGLIVVPPGYLIGLGSPGAFEATSPQTSPASEPGSGAPQPSAASQPASAVDAEQGNTGCADGYVWRLANPLDVVCVTPESRARVAEENRRAPERRVNDGSNTCKVGYVWREAFEGDAVCVAPEVRTLVRQENSDDARFRSANP